jgi:hypothetical protein
VQNNNATQKVVDIQQPSQQDDIVNIQANNRQHNNGETNESQSNYLQQNNSEQVFGSNPNRIFKNDFEDSFLAQVQSGRLKTSADIKIVERGNNKSVINKIQNNNHKSVQAKEDIHSIGNSLSKNELNYEASGEIEPLKEISFGIVKSIGSSEQLTKQEVVSGGNTGGNTQCKSKADYSQGKVVLGHNIDKKIGHFLRQEAKSMDTGSRFDIEYNKENGTKKGRKGLKRFLPATLGEHRLASSPFTTGVLATSFVAVLVGFISFGFQAKGDIEVRGARAVNYIKEAKIDLQNKNFEMATTNLVSAKQEFKEAQSQVDKLGGDTLDIFASIPLLSKISSGKNVVALGEGLTDAVVELSEVSKLLAGVGNPLDLTDKNRSSLTDIFIKIKESIKLSEVSLQKAEKASAKIKINDLPEEYREKISFVKDFLPLVNNSLDEFDRTADIFLELFGHYGPRKYLIVFQNNQEMRATGGFIGSYGLLETSRGRIDKLKIEGIYNPDGQLNVDIVPPRPIQKISASWSTHDANWWPDFPKSAEKITWFYEKTGGPTVDGVIAVTPVLLQKMLEVTGPIRMEEYGKIITSKNFIKEIQQEVEVDYKSKNSEKTLINDSKKNYKTEKSDDKNTDPKKILADLTPILFAKFFDLENPKQAGDVIRIMLEALKEKHILINFSDAKVQKIVSNQGWAGEVLQTEKDYLMVINSNINGYKTDGVIVENIKHQAKIKTDGSIIDTVTITRKHNGGNTKYEWWNKVNADYMRVYVPQGSKLVSVEGQTRELNDEKLNYDKLGFKEDADIRAEENYMEIDEASGTRIYTENNKTVFANWVYVSPQEQVTITYEYLLPFKVDVTSGENNRYSLLAQKQSGSVSSTINSEIEFPFAWKTTWLEPKNLRVDKREGKLIFKHKLDTDQFIGAVFK